MSINALMSNESRFNLTSDARSFITANLKYSSVRASLISYTLLIGNVSLMMTRLWRR